MTFIKGHPQYNTGKTHFKVGHKSWHAGTKGLIKAPKTAFKKGQKPWNTGIKGIHLSPKTEFKKGILPHNWKGDNVGYDALHDWVKRRLGKANICSNNFEHKGPYEWSNISYEYKRILSDWKSLCRSCHHKKDKLNKWGVIKKIFPNNKKREDIPSFISIPK